MKVMDLKPASEFVSLRDAMDKLLEDSFIRPFNGFGVAPALPVDFTETKDAYIVKAAMPGIKPEAITIEATPTDVLIKGELKEDITTTKDMDYLRKELRHGKVQRSFELPLAIDPNKVEAAFEHGIVTITLPKTEVVKPKTITLKPKV